MSYILGQLLNLKYFVRIDQNFSKLPDLQPVKAYSGVVHRGRVTNSTTDIFHKTQR